MNCRFQVGKLIRNILIFIVRLDCPVELDQNDKRSEARGLYLRVLP